MNKENRLCIMEVMAGCWELQARSGGKKAEMIAAPWKENFLLWLQCFFLDFQVAQQPPAMGAFGRDPASWR